MSVVALTGTDTVVINNQVFTGLADGDCIDLKFDQPIAAVKTGKNGNALYALNQSGNQAELMVKLIRGCADDIFLNTLLASQQNNFAGTVLLIGKFIKKLGDGQGNITNDTYVLGGGVFTKIPEAKSNVEGNTDQSTSVYTIRFANAPRALG